jgi:ABC-type phosphate/phosphonate transport system substrate-binding protein
MSGVLRLVSTVCLLWAVLGVASALGAEGPKYVMVVMDPLARPLSCDCVKGYAQRDYDALARHLSARVGREVQTFFVDDLAKAIQASGGHVDLVIGKQSVVKADAAECNLALRPIARLSDKEGRTTLTGLIVVPSGDPAQSLADLKGYEMYFGPPDSDEKHSAAKAALVKAGVEVREPAATFPGCSDAAVHALEHKGPPGAAAVISSYAMALLEGCGTIKKGALRVVGVTEPVPFVTAFVPESMPETLRESFAAGLLAVCDDPHLMTALETQIGVGTADCVRPPFPPNRTGGFLAYGSPFSRFPEIRRCGRGIRSG